MIIAGKILWVLIGKYVKREGLYFGNFTKIALPLWCEIFYVIYNDPFVAELCKHGMPYLGLQL